MEQANGNGGNQLEVPHPIVSQKDSLLGIDGQAHNGEDEDDFDVEDPI